MKKVAVAMAHGHTPKWLQVVLASLKRWNNDTQFDVYVACTWPGHPSIRSAKETALGDGVTIIDCSRRLHSHATALEEILELVWDRGYEYLFACETDCAAMQDGWLDWFVGHMDGNPRAGMAGFFWHEGTNHYNINPSGTLYRMAMLKQYHTEVRQNNSDVFYHPRGNKHGTDAGMDPTIKDVAGCFAETRGIANPNEHQLDRILKGVPQVCWFEPGQWLYCRMLPEWAEVHVPCDHLYTQADSVRTPEATYYGGKANPKFIHYWGGTRAYDFLKHPVNDGFVKGGAAWWLRREDRIWRETVPEEHRKIVHELTEAANTRQKMHENLGFVVEEAL